MQCGKTFYQMIFTGSLWHLVEHDLKSPNIGIKQLNYSITIVNSNLNGDVGYGDQGSITVYHPTGGAPLRPRSCGS